MTLGKDVSALFPDVLKNIATGDLDQKKLVYLYLMYARAVPCGIATDLRPGTMPNRTQTSAFWPSTLSYRTLKIRTRSSARSPSGQWAASVWIRW